MFPGGKGGRCLGLTSLPHSCAECVEIWETQPPGTLRSCPLFALPLPYRAILPGFDRYLGFQVAAGWSPRFSADCRAPDSQLAWRSKEHLFLCFNICAADILKVFILVQVYGCVFFSPRTFYATGHFEGATLATERTPNGGTYDVGCVWNVMAHAQKPDFVFRRNGRVRLNRPGASVLSTTGSLGVRIRGGNAWYTMFRGSVKSTGYPLHSPASPSLPLSCVTLCHYISTEQYRGLLISDVYTFWDTTS